MITLIELNKMPPGGYPYFEPSINWRAPDKFQTWDVIAHQLQVARAQNPAAGLDPSYAACVEAVKLFTCARLHFDPKYCGEANGTTTLYAASSSVPAKGPRCGGCAKR